MKELLGKKLGMTRIFMENGDAMPCTVIEVGPCSVVAAMGNDKKGCPTYQVGFGFKRKNLINKPRAGQFAKSKVEPTRYLKEIKYDEKELEIGSVLKVDIFNEGERVDVTGISRGLGFAGTMKRHNFSGGDATHGQSDRARAPGSIGAGSSPSKVIKGMKMAGRMGKDKVTVLNLEVVKIINEENLLLVKGAVPGFKGSLVKVRITNRG